jgi:uncharacterized protein (TIGR03437 family)
VELRVAAFALLAACSRGDDIPAPTIASIVPERGGPGTVVTVAGDSFCQQPEHDEEDPFECAKVGAVLFGAVPAPVGMYLDTTITAEVPDLASGEVSVIVSVGGRRSNGVSFVVE